MHYYNCREFEPLIVRGAATNLIRHIPTKKEISDSIHREQSILGLQFRSDSSTRWYIIFSIAVCWLSTYFNSIFVPYTASDFQLQGSQQSVDEYLLSITYILAVFTPLFIPRILLFFNGSSLIALICVQFLSLFGEILFYFGIQQNFHHVLLYAGRILIGIALGLNDSVLLSMLIFWFQKTSNLAFSSSIVCVSVVISLLFTNLLIIFKQSAASASSSSASSVDIGLNVLPIVVNFMSVWILFVVNCIKNKHIPPIYDQIILRDFYNNGNILKKLQQFSKVLWLSMLNTALTLSMMNILYTMFMENVLLNLYAFSEKEAFFIILITLVFYILWCLPVAFLIDHYGYYVQWNLLSTFLQFVAMLFLFFGGYHADKIYCIVSLCLAAVSSLFLSSHLPLAILSTKPIELSPYIACIVVSLYWFFTVIFNDIIVWLNNQMMATYLDSVLFVLFVAFVQFAISGIIYGITVKSQLNLHHPTPNK